MHVRRPALLLLAVPLLCAAAWPATIERWSGKYATDRINGSSLLETPKFRSGVARVAGKDVPAKIDKRWTTRMPVDRDGDFFLVRGCKPHACAVENYAVLVDRNLGVVAVCLGMNDGKGIEKHWYGPDRKPPIVTRESDMNMGCSGDPKALFNEAKSRVLPTAG